MMVTRLANSQPLNQYLDNELEGLRVLVLSLVQFLTEGEIKLPRSGGLADQPADLYSLLRFMRNAIDSGIGK